MSAGGSLVLSEWIALCKELGIELHCGDMNPNALAGKYCEKFYTLPAAGSADFVPFVVKNIIPNNYDYYIFHVDEEVIALGENIEQLGIVDINKFLVPVNFDIRSLCDKYTLQRHLPPEILYPDTELLTEKKYFTGSCVIKRRLGRGARDLCICDAKADYDYFVNKINDPQNFIVQDKIEGKIVYFDVLVDDENFIWIGVEKKKIYFGNGVYDFETFYDKKFDNFIQKVVGIFSRNSQNNKYILNIDGILQGENLYLMEVNPRPGIVFADIFGKIPELNRCLADFLNNKEKFDINYNKIKGENFYCQISKHRK